MIIGIAGKKQAGKNTVANIMHGIFLKKNGMISDFNIDWRGRLYVFTTNINGEQGWGEFDISRKDEEFLGWADNNMHPYIKLYSFADTLKLIAVNLFKIPEESVYGTDEQKNQLQEHLLWENMPGVICYPNYVECGNATHGDIDPNNIGLITHKTGSMTAREFLQYFGTNIMRKIFEPIWVEDTIRRIKLEQSLISVIADVRFENEANAIIENGGKLMKLTRNISNDNHSSETSLDNYPDKNYDFIIDNSDKNFTIENLTQEIKTIFEKIKC